MTHSTHLQTVSVIVPCYNEIGYIYNFVRDLLAQDYPSDLLEFIIVDGGSQDGTTEELLKITAQDPRFKIIDNPNRTAPHALNLAIKESKGDLIVRMDVHATYPTLYIKTLVGKISTQAKIGNAGAVLITVPANDLPKSKGIALAMASPLGVGGAKFRTGIDKDTIVDTVPFGCFPKKIFTEVGLFNESLTRSQDYEFNTRLRLKGYKILLTADIKAKYYARDLYSKLISMYFQSAYTKVLSNKMMGTYGNLRQFIPPFFYLALVTGIFLSLFLPAMKLATLTIFLSYNIFVLVYSFVYVLLRQESIKIVPFMYFAIGCMHACYAFGYMKGVLLFFILRRSGFSKSLNITR